jgi:beta-N-acetylglucosaminidase
MQTNVQKEAMRLWEINKQRKLEAYGASKRFKDTVRDWGFKKQKQKQRMLGVVETH